MSNEDVFDFDEVDAVGAARQAREVHRVAVEAAIAKAVEASGIQLRSVAEATRAVLGQLPAFGVELSTTDGCVIAKIDGVERDLQAITTDVLIHCPNLFVEKPKPSGIVRAKSDLPDGASAAQWIASHSYEEYAALPPKRSDPGDGLILCKADLPTVAAKCKFIADRGDEGEAAYAALPLRRKVSK